MFYICFRRWTILENKTFHTTKQLTKILNVDPSTVWRWRKEGMPYEKWGYAVRFELEKVVMWLKEKGVSNGVNTDIKKGG